MLEIRNVEKSFGKHKVLKGLSFDIEKGDIYGFLGPNGAGKSTTINIMSTILKADKGDILYKGKKVNDNWDDYKNALGVVPQNIALYENITAFGNLDFFSQFYIRNKSERRCRCEEVLNLVGLEKHRNEIPGHFSGGMKRRLNLACSIIHKPKILILDEPTVGVDPQSRNKIMELLRKLNDMGTTIIYTSHYMEEVEGICNKVAIIDDGKIIKKGLINEILSRNRDIYIIKCKKFDDAVVKKLCEMEEVFDVKVSDHIKIEIRTKETTFRSIMMLFIENNIEITEIRKENENLERIFLNLTGKKLRD